uniref:Uncharacterized protein n=1 Tax=Romanomermis culicivorax TaxID=13658 RepID=A0A915I4E5_ROMCU
MNGGKAPPIQKYHHFSGKLKADTTVWKEFSKIKKMEKKMCIKKRVDEERGNTSETVDEDSQESTMRIAEMEDETFIWMKTRTYIPPTTTSFVQAGVWPQKNWPNGPIVMEESGKKTLFDIDASIVDMKDNNFEIIKINDMNQGICLCQNELIGKLEFSWRQAQNQVGSLPRTAERHTDHNSTWSIHSQMTLGKQNNPQKLVSRRCERLFTASEWLVRDGHSLSPGCEEIAKVDANCVDANLHA